MKKVHILLLIILSTITLVLLLVIINFDHDDSTYRAGITNEISYSQLQEHNISDSCWILYGQKIYDITTLYSKDSLAVLNQKCGQDVTPIIDALDRTEKQKVSKLFTSHFVGIITPS